MGSKLPISVVIPCYRCATTIEAAIDSVLKQTSLPAEVWLIDDCSGDDTLQHLYQLKADHPDLIKVIALSTNGGPGVARNAGWDAACEPWIAFLDADDVWHPQKLEIQWQWLQGHPEVSLCGHQTRLLDSSINTPAKPPSQSTELTLMQMLISNRLPTRSVMIKKDLPFRFGGKDVSEDYLLWLKAIAAGCVAHKLEICLAYSQRPEHSAGGYSGDLWKHEKRELKCLAALRAATNLQIPTFTFAYIWSLTKYVRRVLRRKLHK